VAELAPLRSEILQVNYAKASDIAVLLKAKENNFLSSRGSVTIDDRTNVLLVQDTAEKLDDIRALVAKLDIPVRQVLIESRVVVADTTFQHALGVRFGITTDNETGAEVVNYGGVTGNAAGADTLYNGGIPTQDNRFNVNLPAEDAGFGTFGTIGLALAKLPFGFLLDLELSAMEADGRGEVISSPRVLTSNQKEASIETGTEVPYQEATSSGATNVEFKKAVLSLKVKPQITPDDRVIMDLSITKDSVNQDVTGGGGEPGIDTNSISSQVLVDNGETVVLGGVFEQNRTSGVRRVPFFGELPYIGWLFRSNFKEDSKKELLIFVTPKIIKETPKL
jgi:type IV pilus assembly protein PilQ